MLVRQKNRETWDVNTSKVIVLGFASNQQYSL